MIHIILFIDIYILRYKSSVLCKHYDSALFLMFLCRNFKLGTLPCNDNAMHSGHKPFLSLKYTLRPMDTCFNSKLVFFQRLWIYNLYLYSLIIHMSDVESTTLYQRRIKTSSIQCLKFERSYRACLKTVTNVTTYVFLLYWQPYCLY